MASAVGVCVCILDHWSAVAGVSGARCLVRIQQGWQRGDILSFGAEGRGNETAQEEEAIYKQLEA